MEEAQGAKRTCRHFETQENLFFFQTDVNYNDKIYLKMY